MTFSSQLSPIPPTRRAARLALAAVLIASAGIGASLGVAQTPPSPPSAPNTAPALVSALSPIPVPDLAVTAWLSLDATSGQVIAAQQIDAPVEPASLTKLMTAYLVFDALQTQRLTLEQTVRISETAQKTEGSRMFIRAGSQVSVHDLLQGLIVQSGNDAAVALAEAIAGSEAAFAAQMNQEAERQGLTGSHFTNAPGLPNPAHVMTVRDIATLAQNLITRFPQFLHYYRQKEYTYNNITQNNRNRLLWLDDTVDGLKTGRTDAAGYCLVATAVRNGRRVITVLTGAQSDAARAEFSLQLLNWSFQNFETLRVLDAQHPAVQARVWQGKTDVAGLGALEPLWVTVPRGKGADVRPVAQYMQPLIAPLVKGARVGDVTLTLDGQPLRETGLFVLDDVEEAGFFGRVFDRIHRFFTS